VAPVGDDASRIKQLQAMLGQSKQALVNRENELRAAIAQRDLLRTQVSGREARIRELEKTSAREIELRQRTAELERQLGELERRLTEAGGLRSRVAELEPLAAETPVLRKRVAQLEAQLGELPVLAKEKAALEDRCNELEVASLENAALQKRVTELEPLAAEAARLQKRLAEVDARPVPRNDAGDDLRQIRGIGPAFAKSLNALGVRSYAQIAAWTDADISKIAEALRIRPDRIRRDDWINRAKKLTE
jgi:predicted flap endonuclease-1-like 5' DNA nuclease